MPKEFQQFEIEGIETIAPVDNYSSGYTGYKQPELSPNVTDPIRENFTPEGSGLVMSHGHLQSENYVKDTAGWRISPDDAEFNVGVSVDSIDIPDAVTTNSFHVDSSGNMWLGDTTFASAPAKISNAGVATLTGATISGTITATTGAIGGFTIGATTLTGTNLILDSSGQRISLGSSNDIIILDADDATYRMWIGNATAASAPFRVEKDGSVIASDFTATGGSISGLTISSIPNNSSTDISLLNFTYNMVFSVTDSNTIAWGSGTISLSNGRTFSISAGNTGNMAALTYIYLDPAVSTTVLQTTTTYSTAVGANKILIGTAQNNTVSASFIPFNGSQPLIDGANIGALSITASNIAASTITAGKLSVSQLSAITADLGSITAGTIVLPSGGFVRSGQTAYDTGTGFYIGNDSATPKLSIGNSAGNKLTWDGTTLSIVGTLAATSTVSAPLVKTFTAGEPITANNAVSISDGTQTFNPAQSTASGNSMFFGDGTNGSDTGEKVAQSFTISEALTITTVTVNLRKTGAPADNVKVTIQADSSGAPDGTPIGSSPTQAGTGLTTSLADYNFTVNASLSGSTTYWIVVERTGASDVANYYHINGQNGSNVYANGQCRIRKYTSGTWDTAFGSADSDMQFTLTANIAAGRVMQSDASANDARAKNFIGFAKSSVSSGASVDAVVAGSATLSGLSAGSQYYASDTAGAISTTAGTVSRKVGIALSTTELLITNIW